MENKAKWSRYFQGKNYEVSSHGDKRFSAFYARLKDGRTIEEAYQLDIKGYRKLGNNPLLGKGKSPLIPMSIDELWNGYLLLWKQFFLENPNLLSEITKISKTHVLTDKFAKTVINQARAISEIINEKM